MQNRHTALINGINDHRKGYNVLTFITHSPYQSNLATLPHHFYLLKAEAKDSWTDSCRKVPMNHTIITPEDMHNIDFDVVISQNKTTQFNIANSFAIRFNIPLICIEHTLPLTNWPNQVVQSYKQICSPKSNIFVSEYSATQWQWDVNDKTVSIIPHGVDTTLFNNSGALYNDGKVLTAVNAYIERAEWCGFDLYKEVTKGLPTNPIGDTPGFSKSVASTEELINTYKNASVFLNTSLISTFPMALCEAAACGTPIVTTSSTAIPEVFSDGIDCWMSNDPQYLKEKLHWMLENQDKAKEMGLRARETAEKKLSLKVHLERWDTCIRKVAGSGYEN